MQAYTRANSRAPAHAYGLRWQTNQHPTVCMRTHTVGYVHVCACTYCTEAIRHSPIFPKAQACMSALRVFHQPPLYFIHGFWINTNRVDECIVVGTNVFVHYILPNPAKLFLVNLSFKSVHDAVLHTWKRCMLSCFFSLTPRFSPYIFILSLGTFSFDI